jgi:hypothetical protein
MNYRDLESVRQIVAAATNLDISYAYEDLVFTENTAFLIQFDDNNLNNLFCYFHEDCDSKSREAILYSLKNVCKAKKCTLELKGDFSLKQKNDEVQIQFL